MFKTKHQKHDHLMPFSLTFVINSWQNVDFLQAQNLWSNLKHFLPIWSILVLEFVILEDWEAVNCFGRILRHVYLDWAYYFPIRGYARIMVSVEMIFLLLFAIVVLSLSVIKSNLFILNL